MNRSRSSSFALAALAALALQACQDQRELTEPARRGVLSASVMPADPAGRHLVVFTAERVPADFGARVSNVGGAVEASLDSIGVAAVTGLSETAAAELATGADVRAVEPDPVTRLQDDNDVVDGSADEAASEAAAPADATASPT